MVNSGSFSSDGDRNTKAGFIQLNNTSDISQSSSPKTANVIARCKSDLSQTADTDSDLPFIERAIEPTPTKTEFNSNILVENYSTLPEREYRLTIGDREDKASFFCSVPLNKVQAILTTLKQDNKGGDIKVKQNNSRKILCLYCERTFVNINLRQKHVERCHSIKQNRRVSSRRNQQHITSTPCVYCDKLTATEHTLQELFQHLILNHSNKYFACLPCEYRFLNSSLLFDHNASNHKSVSFDNISTDDDDNIDKEKLSLLDENDRNYLINNKSEIEIKSENNEAEEEIPVKLTRSRMRSKSEGETIHLKNEKLNTNKKSDEIDEDTKKKSSSCLKQLRNKKMTVKSSKIAIKRSKRLQAKVVESQKKKRTRNTDKNKEKTTKSSIEPTITTSTKVTEKSNLNNSINPYPEFDSYFRVKKITDHSIDNLKISSLTFDDVFDKAFYNRIRCNIQENLLHHIDGKLFKNEESENRISNFEKISNAPQEIQNTNSENYGCELSLNAVTPTTSLLSSSQFGEDLESQIEYGSKPSKKKSQTRKDEVHYKYFTRRKYQASILEHKENRDLSKLDMWTQYIIKSRQQKIIDDKKSAKEKLDYISGEEYKMKIQREELNRILDRRGPFEDLKEEASKKAALDKLNSGNGNNISHESFSEVRALLNDILNRVFEMTQEASSLIEKSSSQKSANFQKSFIAEIPSYLNLRRASSLPSDGEIDKSDKIALICSSQETENFELPTNSVRGKNEKIELTGEWARSRIYVCAACGVKVLNIKQLLEHKSLYHQNVWVQHYEFVGNQSELYRNLSIPGLGKVGFLEDHLQCKQWKRSDARLCTKCGKQCNSLGELHRHILECGGDWTWMLARKKCKYRPFGAKSRRKRRGLIKRIYTQKTEPSEKKTYKKSFDGPRQKPSDADTIQRMLANLPPKRITRKIMSLKDGFYNSRNNQQVKQTNKQNNLSNNCSNLIRRKLKVTNENPKNDLKTNKNVKNSTFKSNKRSLRNINKVLGSRILDTTAALIVKRKFKNSNPTKSSTAKNKISVMEESAQKDDVTEEQNCEEKKMEGSEISSMKQRSVKSNKNDIEIEENKPKRSSPRIDKVTEEMCPPSKMPLGKVVTNKMSIKNFFNIRKNKKDNNLNNKTDENEVQKLRGKRKLNEQESKTEDKLKVIKKSKKESFGNLVRTLSLRKKNIVNDNEKTDLEACLTIQCNEVVESMKDTEVLTKKRRIRKSFRNVIEKITKYKSNVVPETIIQVDGSSQNCINEQSKNDDENNFLLEKKEEKVNKNVTLLNVLKTDPAMVNFTLSKEDLPIPETIFNLNTDDEKILQAKGELDFDSPERNLPDSGVIKADNVINCGTLIAQQPISVETENKSPIISLVSPKLKGKMKKPTKRLNDCIAMLTSKLSQNVENSTSVDSIFNLMPSQQNKDDQLMKETEKVVCDKPPACILKVPSMLEYFNIGKKSEQQTIVDAKSSIVNNTDCQFIVRLQNNISSPENEICKNYERMKNIIEDKERKDNEIINIPIFPANNNGHKFAAEDTLRILEDENRKKLTWNSVNDTIEDVVIGKDVIIIKDEQQGNSVFKKIGSIRKQRKSKNCDLQCELTEKFLDVGFLQIAAEEEDFMKLSDCTVKNNKSTRKIGQNRNKANLQLKRNEIIGNQLQESEMNKLNTDLTVNTGKINGKDDKIVNVKRKRVGRKPKHYEKENEIEKNIDDNNIIVTNNKKLFLETNLDSLLNTNEIRVNNDNNSIKDNIVNDNLNVKHSLTYENEPILLENKIVVSNLQQIQDSDLEDELPLAALFKNVELNQNKSIIAETELNDLKKCVVNIENTIIIHSKIDSDPKLIFNDLNQEIFINDNNLEGDLFVDIKDNIKMISDKKEETSKINTGTEEDIFKSILDDKNDELYNGFDKNVESTNTNKKKYRKKLDLSTTDDTKFINLLDNDDDNILNCVNINDKKIRKRRCNKKPTTKELESLEIATEQLHSRINNDKITIINNSSLETKSLTEIDKLTNEISSKNNFDLLSEELPMICTIKEMNNAFENPTFLSNNDTFNTEITDENRCPLQNEEEEEEEIDKKKHTTVKRKRRSKQHQSNNGDIVKNVEYEVDVSNNKIKMKRQLRKLEKGNLFDDVLKNNINESASNSINEIIKDVNVVIEEDENLDGKLDSGSNLKELSDANEFINKCKKGSRKGKRKNSPNNWETIFPSKNQDNNVNENLTENNISEKLEPEDDVVFVMSLSDESVTDAKIILPEIKISSKLLVNEDNESKEQESESGSKITTKSLRSNTNECQITDINLELSDQELIEVISNSNEELICEEIVEEKYKTILNFPQNNDLPSCKNRNNSSIVCDEEDFSKKSDLEDSKQDVMTVEIVKQSNSIFPSNIGYTNYNKIKVIDCYEDSSQKIFTNNANGRKKTKRNTKSKNSDKNILDETLIKLAENNKLDSSDVSLNPSNELNNSIKRGDEFIKDIPKNNKVKRNRNKKIKETCLNNTFENDILLANNSEHQHPFKIKNFKPVIEKEFLVEATNNIELVNKSELNDFQISTDGDVVETMFQDGHEMIMQDLRRSRRNSGKITCYNETDLTDDIIGDVHQTATNNKTSKKKSKCRNDKLDDKIDNIESSHNEMLVENKLDEVEDDEKLLLNENRKIKMNSDELFDLLKAAPTENIVLTKPRNSFLSHFDEISNDFKDDNYDVFENIIEKSMAVIEENLEDKSISLIDDDLVITKSIDKEKDANLSEKFPSDKNLVPEEIKPRRGKRKRLTQTKKYLNEKSEDNNLNLWKEKNFDSIIKNDNNESISNSYDNESSNSFLNSVASDQSIKTLKKFRNNKKKKTNNKFDEKLFENSELIDNFCEICNKTFCRIENLIKHKRTLTHISKLSEIEAKEAAAEKAKLEQNKIIVETSVIDINSDSSRNDINLSNILENVEKSNDEEPQIIPSAFSINTNNSSLKLADIINDVLNKPVLDQNGTKHNKFSDIIMQNSDVDVQPEFKRCKSLGERKSFDAENTSVIINETNYFEPQISKNAGTILEKQITLLQNMIENRTSLDYIDDISVSSDQSMTLNNSTEICITNSKQEDSSNNIIFVNNTNIVDVNVVKDSFLKPTQYEEISEDSTNLRCYDDQKSRKALNRDEELFLECCSLLKSGSEISNYSKQSNKLSKILSHLELKTSEEPDWLESKSLSSHKEHFQNTNHQSDNSRIQTPLGDNFVDDVSNSNTISSNWNVYEKLSNFEDISQETEERSSRNKSFTFEEVLSDDSDDKLGTEKSNFQPKKKFSNILSKAVESQLNNLSQEVNSGKQTTNESNLIFNDKKKCEELSDGSTNDSKKLLTKGAMKVFEGLKVSIPTDDINLEEVLSRTIAGKKIDTDFDSNLEKVVLKNSKKSKSNKIKSPLNNTFLFKVDKKKLMSKFTKKNKQQEDCKKLHDIYDFEETQDNSDVFAKPDFRSFRNKKCDEIKKIDDMPLDNNENNDNDSGDYNDSISFESTGSSISNVSIEKAKTEENITKKKCMIMGRIFKNAMKSKIDEDIRDIPAVDNVKLIENFVMNCPEPAKKNKLSEEEMDKIFDELINDDKVVKEKEINNSSVNYNNKIEAKPVFNRRKSKFKNRKRNRINSSSTDDEFSLNKTIKKRAYRKNTKVEDNSINLEQELKECIGVASRKSQRKCTSGKQNVLVEYWSSDESSFEVILENKNIEPPMLKIDSNPIKVTTTGATAAATTAVSTITTTTTNECSEMKEVSTAAVFDDTLETVNKTDKNKTPIKKVTKKVKSLISDNEKNKNHSKLFQMSVTTNRRKRAAANPLYHWSSSSEDESQDLIEIKPIRDEIDDDEDRPVQHGWIVGDSPKKLVTMLAQAKGKKSDVDSVKEQSKKRTTSTIS